MYFPWPECPHQSCPHSSMENSTVRTATVDATHWDTVRRSTCLFEDGILACAAALAGEVMRTPAQQFDAEPRDRPQDPVTSNEHNLMAKVRGGHIAPHKVAYFVRYRLSRHINWRNYPDLRFKCVRSIAPVASRTVAPVRRSGQPPNPCPVLPHAGERPAAGRMSGRGSHVVCASHTFPALLWCNSPHRHRRHIQPP